MAGESFNIYCHAELVGLSPPVLGVYKLEIQWRNENQLTEVYGFTVSQGMSFPSVSYGVKDSICVEY